MIHLLRWSRPQAWCGEVVSVDYEEFSLECNSRGRFDAPVIERHLKTP